MRHHKGNGEGAYSVACNLQEKTECLVVAILAHVFNCNCSNVSSCNIQWQLQILLVMRVDAVNDIAVTMTKRLCKMMTDKLQMMSNQ